MKFNLKTLLVLIFTVCILSTLPVAAQSTGDKNAKNEDPEEVTQNVEEAEEKEAAEEEQESKPEEKASKAVLVAAKKDDVSIDNSIVLSEDFAENFAKEAQDATEYPFTIDLTAFGAGIDSVIVPEAIIDAAIETTLGEEPEEEVVIPEDPKSKGKNNTPATTPVVKVDEHLDDIALKLILADGEYSWKKKSLKEFRPEDGAVKLILEKADNTVTKEVTGKTENEKEVTVSFEPDDGKKCGILLVSKGGNGNWDITGEYMFASIIIFIIAIVLLVFINFLVMLAVNLIIIKIYKGRN